MATITLTSSSRPRHVGSHVARFCRVTLMGATLLVGSAAFAAAQAPRGGPIEGIKVHGHWEIEVRNPDGSLATRTEFENALLAGNTVISDLMQGFAVPGRWVVRASGVCGTGSGSVTTTCYMVPAGSVTTAAPELFETLTVIDLGPNLQLFGSFTAAIDGSISSVGTDMVGCGTATARNTANSPAPSQCLPMLAIGQNLVIRFLSSSTPNTRLQSFTGTTLTPIPVTAGQIVQVRVTISFS